MPSRAYPLIKLAGSIVTGSALLSKESKRRALLATTSRSMARCNGRAPSKGSNPTATRRLTIDATQSS